MKTCTLLLIALCLSVAPTRAQEEVPPEGEHPLHTNAKRFAKRASSEAAAALAKGDRKSALESYKSAVNYIPKVDSLDAEYYLYRARFVALALQLASDSIEAEDQTSARAYLDQILAEEMDPENAIAKNLRLAIDPKPAVAAVTPVPTIPATPPSPPATSDTKWNFTLGDTLPDVNREWGFLLFKGVDTGILVDGDIVELVREKTVLATFKATIPDDQDDALVLGVRAPSPIPDALRKGDTFRLKTD